MALSVNNNVAAINTYRNLTSTQSSLGKSLEKLSSGYRINRAADDAAGLAISEGLRSQISGLQQASRNAQDGSNLVATADGALSTVTTILQRMRTLAVQSANDTNSSDARSAISTEVSQLNDELNRISSTTKFGTTSLLNSSATLNFQVGANSSEVISVSLAGANVSNVATALSNQSGRSFDFASANFAAGEKITFTQAGGPAPVTYTSTGPTSAGDFVAKLNADATFKGSFTASLDSNGKVEVTAKSGTGAVTVGTFAADGTTATTDVVSNGAAITGAINLNTQAGATAAIDVIDAQISTVSTARASLGAVQNRLEYTISNLGVATENLTASESAIRDTDMASEMTKFTSRQILAQAGTAMLAQAKNLPQSVLSLLQQ